MDTEQPTIGSAADGELPADAANHGQAPAAADDLDQRLVAALERVGHLTRTMLARRAYVCGLSALQVQLLHHLRTGARSSRVSDLAHELDVSQATVSAALSTMAGKGLVHRAQDPRDRRNSVFTLTGEGESLRARLTEWAQPLEARLAAVDPLEKGSALRLVLGLLADAQREGVISVARTCLTCRHFENAGPSAAGLPYRCALLGTAFADTELRVDCTEHDPADPP